MSPSFSARLRLSIGSGARRVAEVRTRDEALATVDRALGQWTTQAERALAQALAAVTGAHAAAESEVRVRAARVAALEQSVASMRRDDERRARAAQELARARESLQAARQASGHVAGIATKVAALQRAQTRDTSAQVAAARADLSRRASQLGAYRAAGRGAIGGGPVTVALGGLSIGSTAAGSAAWLAASAMADVAIAEADFSDNPIVGGWGRDGFSRGDYRWAVAAWDEVIRPGLDRGLTRDHFAARDAARGALPGRQTANVYDWFLGSDAIVVERRADGSVNVINGRHRLELARELGIAHLPAKWPGQ